MVLDVTLIVLALIFLLIASYTDLKTREVPDWLNYSLIFSALGIRTIFSFEFGWNIIISGLIGFVIALSIALLFYYTGQWGGGDSKLLMGMGAIIGVSYPFQQESLTLFWFFLALLFLGAIYGVMWMVYLSVKKKNLFFTEFKGLIDRNKSVHLSSGALSLSFLAITIADTSFLPFAILPMIIFYLFIFVSAVESSCFINKINPDKLTEGDWLAKQIKINNKLIMRKKTLELNDIIKLRKLHLKGKLNLVSVKEGIPFVPGFLLAYITITFAKNIPQAILKLFS